MTNSSTTPHAADRVSTTTQPTQATGTSTASTAPFLKWVGSKRRLLPQLLPLLPAGRRLVEPRVQIRSATL